MGRRMTETGETNLKKKTDWGTYTATESRLNFPFFHMLCTVSFTNTAFVEWKLGYRDELFLWDFLAVFTVCEISHWYKWK